MKVAIMGAGLSGLSCAITLEKNGIHPTIFEKRSRPGDRFINGEILLSILNRPIHDSLSYLSEEHNIFLHPAHNITKLILYSQNEKAVIEGNLGYTNIRGRHPDSFDSQLANQVKSKIVFNSTYSYEALQRDFSHVVMATGDAAYAEKYHNFQEDLTVTLKGATVVGNFDPYCVMAWLDYTLAPMGYGYLIPFSEKEANIVIGYPDYPENRHYDTDTLWGLFYDRVCKDLNQNLKVRDNFQVTRYIIGLCHEARIGNTFFTGNNFGSILPFLGFGQLMALLTGVYAAHDLTGQSHYGHMTQDLRKDYKNSLVFRRYLEQVDNPTLDKIVKSLKGKLGNRLFNSHHLDPLRYMSYLLRPLVYRNTDANKRRV